MFIKQMIDFDALVYLSLIIVIGILIYRTLK